MTYKCGFIFIPVLLAVGIFLDIALTPAWATDTSPPPGEAGTPFPSQNPEETPPKEAHPLSDWTLFCGNEHRDAFSVVFSLLTPHDLERLSLASCANLRLDGWRQTMWKHWLNACPTTPEKFAQYLMRQGHSPLPFSAAPIQEKNLLFHKTLFGKGPKALREAFQPHLEGKPILYIPKRSFNDPLAYLLQDLLKACGWSISSVLEGVHKIPLEQGGLEEGIHQARLEHLALTFPINALALPPKPKIKSQKIRDIIFQVTWFAFWNSPPIRASLEAYAQMNRYIPFSPDLTPEALPEGESHIIMTDVQLSNPENKRALDALMETLASIPQKSPRLIFDVGGVSSGETSSRERLEPTTDLNCVRSLFITNARRNIRSVRKNFFSSHPTLEEFALCLPAAQYMGAHGLSRCAHLRRAFLHLPKLVILGENLFYNNGSLLLADIYAPETTKVGKKTFSSCTQLKRADLSFPQATEISPGLFFNCKNFGEGYLNFPRASSIRASLLFKTRSVEMLYMNFPNMLRTETCFFYGGQSSEEVDLNFPKLGYIGPYFFAFCNVKRVSLYAPEATYIASNLFYGCKFLEEVNLSGMENLDFVGGQAFFGCEKLRKVICHSEAQLEAFRGNIPPEIFDKIEWEFTHGTPRSGEAGDAEEMLIDDRS